MSSVTSVTMWSGIFRLLELATSSPAGFTMSIVAPLARASSSQVVSYSKRRSFTIDV